MILVYTAAISLDMRRLELSDLIEQSAQDKKKSNKLKVADGDNDSDSFLKEMAKVSERAR
eukprot:m.107392 g.107392  ORF g.107392 m.107392 type:complete len:60 (+) comp9174_c0_seq2:1-180(+)